MAKTAHQDQLALIADDYKIDSVFELTPEKLEMVKRTKPKLLGIKCSRSDCRSGLHCFDSTRKHLRYNKGACQQCGVELVDWDVMWDPSNRNVDEKFALLQKEWIRHFFFHVPITPRIERYAVQQGVSGLASQIQHQLEQNKMLRFMPALDAKQTKMLDGTIVHWARHAVACCCRACMSYWHNVPLAHVLTPDDISYFRELALKYVMKRMPQLPLEPSRKLVTARKNAGGRRSA